ncbi:MFS general substrate transporter [Aureobasidium sp. EXF-10728]|nr:MFS general substrate transporter [Aureobasidium sp. EXF-10728]
MATPVEMTVSPGQADNSQGDENKDANVTVWDAESDISKNPKQISWFVIFASALANFSDGYQNNLSSHTNVVFKHTLGTAYTSTIQTRISNALLVGAVIGIILLGYACDIWSRRGGLWVTSSLVVIGSLLATLVFQVQGQGVGDMMWYMTIARGITGVGVGGEYPPSAAAALEGSNEHYDHIRGPIQVLTSTLMATSAAPICTAIYLITLTATHNNLRTAFHAIYAISIFLPLIVAFLRFRMRDGLLFRRNNFKTTLSPPYLLVLKRYGWRLLGTSSAFFVYDFINFPNSIMSSAIINNVVPGKDVRQTAIWQFILALLAVPGPIVGSWLCNRIGRRWTGIAGWTGYIALGFIIGGCYTHLTTHAIAAFVVLYGLMQCFGHMGPGATIGLMSVELYPTAVRGVSYGVSAAFGKAGAAIGTQVFTPIRDACGPASTFYLLGGLSVLGAGIYYILPEGRDLDLAAEDESFKIYLRSEGFGAD